MPKFQYKVKREAEGVTTGVMEADTQRAVVAQLRDMGYFPISVEEYSELADGIVLKVPVSNVRLKDRNYFFRQLANLLESGMPILRALSTLRDQATNAKVRSMVDELHGSVQQGNSFADALESYPKIFPAMYSP